MGLKTFEQAIFFIILFGFVFSLYGGQATNNPSFQQSNTIAPPVLAPLPGAIKCSPFDYVCNATASLSQATAYIGWAFVNLPVIIIFVTTEMLGYLDTSLVFATSPQLNANGIPLMAFFFAFVGFLVITGAFKIFRGVAEGL